MIEIILLLVRPSPGMRRAQFRITRELVGLRVLSLLPGSLTLAVNGASVWRFLLILVLRL